LAARILLMPVAFVYQATLSKALLNAQERLNARLQTMPSQMA
jgi:hypothetical protein